MSSNGRRGGEDLYLLLEEQSWCMCCLALQNEETLQLIELILMAGGMDESQN